MKVCIFIEFSINVLMCIVVLYPYFLSLPCKTWSLAHDIIPMKRTPNNHKGKDRHTFGYCQEWITKNDHPGKIVRFLPDASPDVCQLPPDICQTSTTFTPDICHTSDRYLVDVWYMSGVHLVYYGTVYFWWAYGTCQVYNVVIVWQK